MKKGGSSEGAAVVAFLYTLIYTETKLPQTVGDGNIQYIVIIDITLHSKSRIFHLAGRGFGIFEFLYLLVEFSHSVIV